VNFYSGGSKVIKLQQTGGARWYII